MLSQYDRQQLEMISNRLRMEDPDLAKALRDGNPLPLPQTADRRWPFVVLVLLAGLVVVAGILVGSFGFIFLGAMAIAGVTLYFRRHRRKAPRVRDSRRQPRG